jgi:putative toxin-antitoxin system antitoxin component (TIGR02293 family)
MKRSIASLCRGELWLTGGLSNELLTHDESDRAVRIARITSQAEEVFGDDAKAARWLRKPKARFEGRVPLELLRTEAGSRIVEEMLLQIDYCFAA